MTLTRFRRQLGWDNPVLSLLIGLSGGLRFTAWGNMVGKGDHWRYDINLCGNDLEMVKEVARYAARLCLPQAIAHWNMVDGRHVVSLQYAERPEPLWTRPELYELTGDIFTALMAQEVPRRTEIPALLRRQRLSRLVGQES